jgi:hypothetical protein
LAVLVVADALVVALGVDGQEVVDLYSTVVSPVVTNVCVEEVVVQINYSFPVSSRFAAPQLLQPRAQMCRGQ